MEAGINTLDKFLESEGVEFYVPVYQRPYSWDEEQCKELLIDIMDIGSREDKNDKHFIGNIVYVSMGNTSSRSQQRTIVDGQQRITTITLMLLAMHFRCIKDNLEYTPSLRSYIFNGDHDFAVALKIKQNESVTRDIQALILDNNINENSRVIKNYMYFYNRLDSLEKIDKALRGFKRLSFVEIALDKDKDNPQKIFERINSTGKPLTQGDLVRNYILMGFEPKAQDELYNVFWKEIEDYTKKDNKSFLDDFIRCYLTIKTGDIVSQPRIYNEFKRYFKDEKIKSEVSAVLKDIALFSKMYSNILRPTDSNLERSIIKEIEYINDIRTTVAYPLMMIFLKDYSQHRLSKDELKDLLLFIQTIVIRRFVVDGLTTNYLNKLFASLIKITEKDNYPELIYKNVLERQSLSRIPKDNEVERYFKTKDIYSKSYITRYILERLENYGSKEPITIKDNPIITIEHIFPQNPCASWKQDIRSDEYNAFKNNYLNTVGNLTLSGNNGDLGNKSFIEKKNMNKDDKCQGYIYSRLFLNESLKEFDCWSVENYLKRSQIMTKKFLKVWALPIDVPDNSLDFVYHADTTNEDSNRVFDSSTDLSNNNKKESHSKGNSDSSYLSGTIVSLKDLDPKKTTNLHFDYIEINGLQLISENGTGKDIFTIALKQLYSKYTNIFEDRFRDLLKIKRDPKELRSSISLADNLYIEGNLSNTDKFRRVKNVFESLNLSEISFIKIR